MISYQLAKLLKEKGIQIETNNTYFYKDEINNIKEHQIKNRDIIYDAISFNYEIKENEYQTYTIAEIVMWLYKKHNIWISVDNLIDNRFYFSHRNTKTEDYAFRTGCNEDGYNSPTEAYEAAIKYTLNNII